MKHFIRSQLVEEWLKDGMLHHHCIEVYTMYNQNFTYTFSWKSYNAKRSSLVLVIVKLPT